MAANAHEAEALGVLNWCTDNGRRPFYLQRELRHAHSSPWSYGEPPIWAAALELPLQRVLLLALATMSRRRVKHLRIQLRIMVASRSRISYNWLVYPDLAQVNAAVASLIMLRQNNICCFPTVHQPTIVHCRPLEFARANLAAAVFLVRAEGSSQYRE